MTERDDQWRIAYAASKAAIGNMGRNLARQLAPDGITVNVLCPGAIETEGNAAVLADPAYRREVAAAALFLCSRLADYLSGVELRVDGAAGC